MGSQKISHRDYGHLAEMEVVLTIGLTALASTMEPGALGLLYQMTKCNGFKFMDSNQDIGLELQFRDEETRIKELTSSG